MVNLKSKSKRAVQRRLPGHRTALHLENKLPGKARCARCGAELHGIPRRTRKLSKSQKTVNRMFGGHYCSRCAREELIRLNAQ